MENGEGKFARQATGVLVQFLILLASWFVLFGVLLLLISAILGDWYKPGPILNASALVAAWWISSLAKRAFYEMRGWDDASDEQQPSSVHDSLMNIETSAQEQESIVEVRDEKKIDWRSMINRKRIYGASLAAVVVTILYPPFLWSRGPNTWTTWEFLIGSSYSRIDGQTLVLEWAVIGIITFLLIKIIDTDD